MKRFNVIAMAIVAVLFIAAALAGHGTSPAGSAIRLSNIDFVVTSSADAGPGTLRDAILAADRLTSRAHIVVKVREIAVESALPALINPRGIIIEADKGFGIIDGGRQQRGAVLQITSPTASLRGLSVVKAHDMGIVITAMGVELTSVTIARCKVGLVLGSAAKSASIRTSLFDQNETAITAEAGLRDVSILSSIIRESTKAGFWFVGSGDSGDPVAARVRIIDTVFEKNLSGAVLANRPTLLQKCRFIGNKQSAILILGGSARVEDSEFKESGGTAISVSAGQRVNILRNTLSANPTTAIMVRDSQAVIEGNTLRSNGFGIVVISGNSSANTLLKDNVVTQSLADAVTVIGGAPRLQNNQIVDNHGAGVRALNLMSSAAESKAVPILDSNVVKGNGADMPPVAVYRLAGALAR